MTDSQRAPPSGSRHSAPERTALVITKPMQGNTADELDRALAVLRSYNVHCEQHLPEDGAALKKAVQSGRLSHDVVILAGGDGTLHLALPMLMGEGAPPRHSAPGHGK